MKKFLYAILFVFVLTFATSVSAATLKVVTETKEAFSTANPTKNMVLVVEGDYELPNGEYIPDDTIIKGTIVQIVDAKRGKRDAYVYMQINEFKLPNASTYHHVDDPKAVVKLSKYKPLDIKTKSVDVGVTAAGFFVKNISYPVNFVRGAVAGVEDGKNPIVSGAQMTYEKSFFSYISKGKPLEVPAGSKLIMTLTFAVD